MQIVIDILEDKYNQIVNSYQGSNVRPKDYEIAIINGIPIPDNATNADVIRTLFPDGIPKDIVWTLQGDKGANWWNAPYKKGGKVE